MFPSLFRVSQPSKFLRVLASVTVALQILTKGEVVDDWFQLRASHSRTEAGTVRIKARYMVSFLSTKKLEDVGIIRNINIYHNTI